ncbi:hypothetical protein GW17_00002975 [Ensete ventricosum]|nr:hypothetical protein GW17_00002975 [Ensete ventricosum]RZS04706.1 hypothetical protein BHM03_00035100 [Ensete ventricosum]
MPVSTIAQSSPEVQEIQAEAIPQKGTEAYGKQPTEGAPHLQKKVKASYHHKSRQGGESSKSHLSKSKEQVISVMDNKVEGLKKENIDLRARSRPKTIAAVEQQASVAQDLADHMKVELEEEGRHRESLEIEIENYHLDLVDS